MAKIAYGPIVSDASGKTAGTVFSKWRTRSYIRRLVRPANPKTTAQQAIRGAFIIQTQRFLRGDSDFLQAWLTYAAGKPVTDRSAFIGKTAQPKRLGEAWLFTPHQPHLFPVRNLVVTPGVAQLGLAWDNDILPTTGKTIIWWVQETDDELTINAQEELVDAESSDILTLVAAKLYTVGVTKCDSGTDPLEYSLATVDQGTPT